ncbi:hypothetical protein JCM9279_006035 [Rhodotorula babjevae]
MSASNGQQPRWDGVYGHGEYAHQYHAQHGWQDHGHQPQAGPSGWNGGGQYNNHTGATSFDVGPQYPPHLVDQPYFPDPQWPPHASTASPAPTPSSYLDYGRPWVPPMPTYNSAFDYGFNPFVGPSVPFAPFATPFHPTPPAFARHGSAPHASPEHEARGAGDDVRWRDRQRGDGARDGGQASGRRADDSQRPRGNSRSRSPEPYVAAPAPYGPDGEYIPPTRRVRKDVRSAPVVPPTEAYLAASALASTTLPLDDHLEPLYLVMDLNQTLLARANRDRVSSRWPIARPYLSTFLSYICTRNPDGSPRFEPIVYSSARAPNVLSMLAALQLVPPERATAYVNANPTRSSARPPMYEPRPDEGDVLRMVFTRSMMGLSTADYHGDVETVKDLARVWELLDFGRDALEAEEQQVVDRNERLAASRALDEDAATRAGSGSAPEGAPAALESAASAENGREEPSGALKRDRVRLSKKAKIRVAQQLEARGALRTLLLDDEASKVAQQPYSHLPIAPFLVHPVHFPPTPDAAFDSTNPVSALSLDPTHPPAQDCALLIAIAQLERARAESNVAGWVRAGGLDAMRDEVRAALGELDASDERIDEGLAEQGREVCARYGIELKSEWDSAWRRKLLDAGRAPGREMVAE